MNREIKFRAWNKDASKMYEVLILGDDYIEAKCTTQPMLLEHVELMQFTGLRDKNGVEIYEGDIVYCVTRDPFGHPEQDAQFVVGFDYCSFLAMAASEEQEVIGNIHQNPEPIKG